MILQKIFKGWWDAFRHYFYFMGRTNRTGFWSFALLNNIIFFLLFIIDNFFQLRYRLLIGKIYCDFHLLSSAFLLLSFFPTLCLCVRRLHDLNYRGWWMIFIIPTPSYISFFCQLAFLVIASLPGTKQVNRFGLEPTGKITT